jgi:dihydroorotase
MDKLIINADVILPKEVKRLNVGIANGAINYLGTEQISAQEVIDGSGLHLFPGFIDSQVHFREPGLTHKEDLASGSLQALYGGICTYLEMPNTKPPTLDASAIAEKVAIARKNSYVDFGFFLGADGSNLEAIARADKIPGCCGIKIFLGSSTGPLLLTNEEQIVQTLMAAKLPVSIHSENEALLKERFPIVEKSKNVSDHPHWRSVESALSSTKKIVELARRAKKKIHILHITTKEEIDFLKTQTDICTFEVLPQHLWFHAPDCYEKHGTLVQMNPPIRSIDHRDKIRWAVSQKIPYVLGSDHAPHTLEEKNKPYPTSPSGIPGVQLMVPLLLTLRAELELSLVDIKNYLSSHPAKLFGMTNKGEIELGKKADLVLIDLKKSFKVELNKMKSKCGQTPYEGETLKGEVKHVLLKGQWALKDGVHMDSIRGETFI